MDQVWFVAALWLFLALVAVLLANWLRVSTALSEIVVGTVAQLAIGAFMGSEALGAKAPWVGSARTFRILRHSELRLNMIGIRSLRERDELLKVSDC